MTGIPHRYVFVGGLHRSGTSVMARTIAKLSGVSGIEGAPIPENEGVYLQGAIPHTARSGVPMHFATDPAQHMTETHPLNTLETRTRLIADWDPWFDPAAAWRVEKSPVNLTRMRLLQQLFPLSQFVVVIRHPEAVAAATAKWCKAPTSAMIDYWIAAHALVARDLEYLHAWLIIRYEDLVANPSVELRRLAAFLGRPCQTDDPEIFDGNPRYNGCPIMQARHVASCIDWGYGPGLQVNRPLRMLGVHPLRSVSENPAFIEQR